jgi:hypothetical protein
MTEYVILPPNHWFYQVAQLLFVMSYIPVNLLYLRLCLLGATFFITIWCIFVLAISLDGAIWNGFQTCVNLTLLVLMFTDRIPITYSKSGERLSRVFGNVCGNGKCIPGVIVSAIREAVCVRTFRNKPGR